VVTITKGVLSPSKVSIIPMLPKVMLCFCPKTEAKRHRDREKLMEKYGCRLAVIVGDSRTQPLRLGCVA